MPSEIDYMQNTTNYFIPCGKGKTLVTENPIVNGWSWQGDRFQKHKEGSFRDDRSVLDLNCDNSDKSQ